MADVKEVLVPGEPRRDRQIETVAVLADPVRRRLYDAVVASDDGLSREQAADSAGVPAHSARFHLDKLTEAGLLAVTEQRLSGRSGPGAGRPAKVYHRTSAAVAVSVPARHYELVGEVFAAAVSRSLAGEDLAGALADEARSAGRADGGCATVDPGAGEEDRTAAVLTARGYAPYSTREGVRLRNCPFDALAREHTDLVCGVNLEYVTGVVEGLACTHLGATLDPGEDRCCVRVSRER